MEDIQELERRINAAMDRIAQAVDGLGGGQTAEQDGASDSIDPAEIEALRRDLEEERTANGQLEERLRTVKERYDARQVELESQIDDQRGTLAALDSQLQSLKAANAQLRDNNRALRQANEEGVGEPDLINTGILAELDALRTARAVDVAEADAILSAIVPLVNGSTKTATKKEDS